VAAVRPGLSARWRGVVRPRTVPPAVRGSAPPPASPFQQFSADGEHNRGFWCAR